MSAQTRWIGAAALVWMWVAASAPLLQAHPTSTFGVRLRLSPDRVTVTLNADVDPLLAKLEALAEVAPTAASPHARIREYANTIAALSSVTTPTGPVQLSLWDVRDDDNGQVLMELRGLVPPGTTEVWWQSRMIFGTYPLSLSHGTSDTETVLWLQGPETAGPWSTTVASSGAAAVGAYVGLGIEHIVPKGLDHILFVLGLFLLTPRIRPLLAQVSIFTLAHSVSLALATSGAITLPASVVEPMIALSIAYVGVENLRQRTLSRWRVCLVGAFGLLHGLGFAGVLSELAMPRGQWLAALLGFNIGVELGQLLVLGLALGVWLAWARWLTVPIEWLRRGGSVGIAAMGVFWVMTRL